MQLQAESGQVLGTPAGSSLTWHSSVSLVLRLACLFRARRLQQCEASAPDTTRPIRGEQKNYSHEQFPVPTTRRLYHFIDHKCVTACTYRASLISLDQGGPPPSRTAPTPEVVAQSRNWGSLERGRRIEVTNIINPIGL